MIAGMVHVTIDPVVIDFQQQVGKRRQGQFQLVLCPLEVLQSLFAHQCRLDHIGNAPQQSDLFIGKRRFVLRAVQSGKTHQTLVLKNGHDQHGQDILHFERGFFGGLIAQVAHDRNVYDLVSVQRRLPAFNHTDGKPLQLCAHRGHLFGDPFMRVVHHPVRTEQEDISAVRLANFRHAAKHPRDGCIKIRCRRADEFVQKRNNDGLLLQACPSRRGSRVNATLWVIFDNHTPLSAAARYPRPYASPQYVAKKMQYVTGYKPVAI